MARARLIHPGGPKDEAVAALSLLARLAWAYLPCHADREGRLADKPFTLRLEIFPVEPGVDMGSLLDELAGAGLIVRYAVGSHRFIQVRNFGKFQHPHKNESASVIPPPPTELDGAGTSGGGSPPANGGSAPVQSQPMAVASPPTSGPLRLDPVPDPVPDPVDLSPRAGALDPTARTVTGHDLATTFARVRSELYPGVTSWNTAGVKPEKASRMADLFCANPETIADIEPTMRLLLEQARGEKDDRAREAAFAFGSWCSRFPDLRDELRGTKPGGKPKYQDRFCEGHRNGKNNLRPSPKPTADCPECKHVARMAKPRPASEPSGFTPPAPWPAKEPRRLDVRVPGDGGELERVEPGKEAAS